MPNWCFFGLLLRTEGLIDEICSLQYQKDSLQSPIASWAEWVDVRMYRGYVGSIIQVPCNNILATGLSWAVEDICYS